MEILEIPETVFREALINALAHRDYYERGANIMVEIYDNRVEITNPGGLISTIPVNEFGTRSFSRNPLVFGFLKETHFTIPSQDESDRMDTLQIIPIHRFFK